MEIIYCGNMSVNSEMCGTFTHTFDWVEIETCEDIGRVVFTLVFIMLTEVLWIIVLQYLITLMVVRY